MQLFLHVGVSHSSSTVLDLGCGPMRLGSVLIPMLKEGWYYGQDINPNTIAFGEEVLREAGIPEQITLHSCLRPTNLTFELVDRPVQIAFSNSLFSHLTLNSIFCGFVTTETVLAPSGVLVYATFFALESGRPWLNPIRATSGDISLRLILHQDPYHYPLPLLQDLARQAGFHLDVVNDFGIPPRLWGGSANQGSTLVQLTCYWSSGQSWATDVSF